MLGWPIRLKLIVGLSVVVGMMLILIGASIFGLHSFHLSYLTLVDQMREIGASGALMGSAVPLRAPRTSSPEEVDELKRQVIVSPARPGHVLQSIERRTPTRETASTAGPTSWGWRS